MIGEDSDKKSDKNHNKSHPCKSEHIENLIICTSIVIINPSDASHIEECFEYECRPKYPLVNMVEYDKKCEVDEWKKEHRVIIWS